MRKRIFFGWYIVIASTVITAAGIGFHTSTDSMLVKPVCGALHLSRGEFTFYRTIVTLLSTVLMPVYAKLVQKHGIKKVMLTGTIFSSLSFAGYSLCTKLWHFYAIAVINGLFMNGAHFMVVGILISNWFKGNKGLATGIAYCGSGPGAAVMIPIVTRIVELGFYV